jgi:hypothetical protein
MRNQWSVQCSQLPAGVAGCVEWERERVQGAWDGDGDGAVAQVGAFKG